MIVTEFTSELLIKWTMIRELVRCTMETIAMDRRVMAHKGKQTLTCKEKLFWFSEGEFCYLKGYNLGLDFICKRLYCEDSSKIEG